LEHSIQKVGKKNDQIHGLQAKIVGLRAEDARKDGELDKATDTINRRDC
jgi:hypothetical protein